MAASGTQIHSWLRKAKADPDVTHMLVKCDTFEYDGDCCYPVYVHKGEDVNEVNAKNGDRFMECYAMHLPIHEQFLEHRSRHFEYPEESG